jgi:hypothetical protein
LIGDIIGDGIGTTQNHTGCDFADPGHSTDDYSDTLLEADNSDDTEEFCPETDSLLLIENADATNKLKSPLRKMACTN